MTQPPADPPVGQTVIIMPTYNERQNLESIAGRVRVLAPTVANNDDNRTLGYCNGHVENPLLTDAAMIASSNFKRAL